MPDAIVRVRMFDSVGDNTRRHKPIMATVFGCPLFFDDSNGHDARFYFAKTQLPVRPGDIVIVPIKFLYGSDVARLLQVGRKFKLWESGFFAEGEVVEVTNDRWSS